MVEPKVKAAPKSKPPGAKPSEKKEKKLKKGAPKEGVKKAHGSGKNYELGSGVYLYSQKKNKAALYKYVHNRKKKTHVEKKPLTIVKQIGGDKNGGTRVVPLKKKKSHFPTMDRIKPHPARKLFSQHKRKLRKTLTPGTVVILLAGTHKGKRVIFLKQLASGLLLVNGPFKTNACPLRRVSQRYVIATKTKIDLAGAVIPEHINDDYFKRKREKRAKKEEGDIFNKKKEFYKPSEQKKTDQKTVDKICSVAIKKFGCRERRLFYQYLSNMFGLRSSQFPHRLNF